MLDAEQIDNFAEPRLALAPLPLAPSAMLLWAGVFAAVYYATTSMLAAMYARS
jgi:hypothetical protein